MFPCSLESSPSIQIIALPRLLESTSKTLPQSRRNFLSPSQMLFRNNPQPFPNTSQTRPSDWRQPTSHSPKMAASWIQCIAENAQLKPLILNNFRCHQHALCWPNKSPTYWSTKQILGFGKALPLPLLLPAVLYWERGRKNEELPKQWPPPHRSGIPGKSYPSNGLPPSITQNDPKTNTSKSFTKHINSSSRPIKLNLNIQLPII